PVSRWGREMLRTRLWMGGLLACVALGVLVVDRWLYPWFPFLLVSMVGMAWAATAEFLTLLPPDRRPPFWFCFGSVAALIASNWPASLLNWLCRAPASPWHLPDWACPPPAIMDNNHPMHWLTGTFAAVVLSSFLAEMIAFRKPGGGSVTRIASSVLIATYLGVLPSFFLQLRWPPIASMADAKGYQGTLAVTLAVFVPKCCDIGAYLV